jgi:hypothetical protein
MLVYVIARLAGKDVERLKDHWLGSEVRSDTSWKDLLKTFKTNRTFSVDPRSAGVELRIRAHAHENIMLIFCTGKLSNIAPYPLATLTLMKVTWRQSIVRGGTFVFKAAKQPWPMENPMWGCLKRE